MNFRDREEELARLTALSKRREGGLAGSSQRMMQGLEMAASAPLFGRARELFTMGPLPPAYAREAFGNLS